MQDALASWSEIELPAWLREAGDLYYEHPSKIRIYRSKYESDGGTRVQWNVYLPPYHKPEKRFLTEESAVKYVLDLARKMASRKRRIAA